MNFKEYQTVAKEITQTFSKMDQENDKFSQRSGIQCVSTCGGVCCKNTDVEVSPVDLIPLVLNLLGRNILIETMVQAKTQVDQPCLLFKHGRCSEYANRATLCRLFGYASVYNKQKNKVLSVCSHIKAEQNTIICPVLVETAPNLVDYAQQINNLVPAWDSKTLPFNQAFIYAAERILNSYSYEDATYET